ncbi:MAG: phosphomannomutase/phosphoglucomutase [Cyanobacteria bacterium P01_E01_bin.48]
MVGQKEAIASEFDWKRLQNGSDIRGVALDGVPGETVNLTADVADVLGRAFVQWLSQATDKPAAELTIAVGRDSRISGPALMQAVTHGIAEQGCCVYDFAMASTPAMFMSTVTPDFECDGAIMLTASHLPFNRNGLKFFTARGGLEKADIKAILGFAERQEWKPASTSGEIIDRDFISMYADRFVHIIRDAVDSSSDRDRPLAGLKIVVDAGNGAGGFFASQVLEPLGADTTGSQFLEPDGTFPNHVPNPENAEAMASLRQAVKENRADFGIIFDTDVDRSAAVDSAGNDLNRNRLIALMSAIVLREHPGSAIVTDSITSDGLTTFIESDLNGKHHRFKRGYKNVINEAKRLNEEGQESWLAIETSGHAAMRENYFLDDGAYLISKVLIDLAKAKLAGRSLSDLIANLQEPKESREFRLKLTGDDFTSYGNDVIDKLKRFANSQPDWELVPNNYEGVRIACRSPEENGWFLLRLSLHDPVMPLNIETNVAEGVSRIASRLLSFFEGLEAIDSSPLK